MSAVDKNQEGKGRVLIVDDDPAMRLSIEGVLSEDFETEAVSNSADAEQALARSRFDVVLADYEMPGGSGMDFLKRMAVRFPDVMGILVTGHPDHPEVMKAEQEGMVVRVIAKPFAPARLLKWVENTIQLSRMRQATNRLGQRIAPPRPV